MPLNFVLGFKRNDRRSDRCFAAGHIDVRYPADMPKLKEHPSPFRVDAVDRFFPAGDLFIGIDTRCTQVTATRDRNRGCLGNNQPTFRSALGIILNHQGTWDVARLLGPLTREGGHYHAMRQADRAELDG
jgi:hypothetical protein